jgi:hypothetical protein
MAARKHTLQHTLALTFLLLSPFAACSGGDEILGALIGGAGAAGFGSDAGGQGGTDSDGSADPDPIDPPR